MSTTTKTVQKYFCDIKLFGVNWKDETVEEDGNYKNYETDKEG